MESFRYQGIWWDPNSPDDEWAGTLHFDRREGLSLELTVAVEKSVSFPSDPVHERVLGVTPEGKQITLLRCFEQRSHGGLFGGARVRQLNANAAIVGFHADTVDPLLSSVRVRFEHLDEWHGKSTLKWDHIEGGSDLLVRYTCTEPLLLHDDGAVRISLQAGLTGGVGNRQASLREETWFVIHTASPVPLSEFQEHVRACGDFLSIGCLALCEVENFELEPPAAGPIPVSGSFYAKPVYLGSDSGSSIIGFCLFTFRDIGARAPELFSSWFSQRETLNDARALYFLGTYGSGFLEGKLQSLTQGIEALHRRTRPGRYVNDAAFRLAIASVIAAIPPDTDERLAQSMRDRLRFANEYSQRDRLESLVLEYASALQALVTNPVAYVPAIVKHRNTFTHFDPKARKADIKRPIARERVLLYNYFLRLLLEACLLGTMGFGREEIESLFKRSETYRQLSARLHAWAIQPPPLPPAGPS